MKAIFAFLVALFVIAIPAAAQTTVDTYWNGAGYMDTTFMAGDDAWSYLETQGSLIGGEFHGKDYDDNPYTYGVDTYFANVDAGVNSGYIEFETQRTDSKTSYGNPGQRSYSWVSSTDGLAEMAWYTKTNYAEMGNCQYAKPTTTNGKNFEASGSNYQIYHEVTDSDGDGSFVGATGSGSSMIKLQGEKAAGSGFNMGRLPVCGDGCAWDNNYATFSGSGTGHFDVHAWADNGLTVGGSCPNCDMAIPGDGNDDSAKYDLHVQYAGSWSYSDFGVSGS